jgi:hypothetical protein
MVFWTSSLRKILKLEPFLVFSLCLFCFIFATYQNLHLKPAQEHYSILATSFLSGRMDIPSGTSEYSIDTIIGREGKHIFGGDPLTAVFMIPFVLFMGHGASQAYLSILLIFINLFLVYKILCTFHLNNGLHKWWFILIYFFASSMVSVIFLSSPWYLAQNLGTSFILWGLYEWRTRKRLPILFLCILLATLSKRTMGFPLLLYLLVSTLLLEGTFSSKIKRAFFLGLGEFLGILVLTIYFLINIPLSSYRNLPYHAVYEDPYQRIKLIQYGSWNIKNIPTNFVNLFILGPEVVRERDNVFANISWPYLFPRQEGVSFFLLSPIFFCLFFLSIKRQEGFPVLAALGSWCMMYLPFYASGAIQFGARYTVEFVPFLFLLLVSSLSPFFNWKGKVLTVFSVCFNMFLYLGWLASQRFR